MSKFIFLCCFSWAVAFMHAQAPPGYRRVETGEQMSETLRLLDSNNRLVAVKVPSDTCMLFYRFRGNAWLTDNRDSVEKIQDIISYIQSGSGACKNLRVICYSYNHDNFIKTANHAPFSHSRSYRAEYYCLPEKSADRLTHSDKLILLDKKGRVLASSPYIGSFSYKHKAENKKIKAKLLTEKNGVKIPLINTTVYLFSRASKDTVSFAQTNRYGDFEMVLPENSEEHTIKVEPLDKSIKNIILANQEGVEQARLQRSVSLFQYKLIDADIARLSDMPEEDLSNVLIDFLKSSEREFVRSESIKYGVGSYTIPEESKIILDKMAEILNDHPGLRLDVISHTDAQGDDKMNLELSQKRSLSVVSYLILIGIDHKRLGYKGKGESEIRNRCKNGVDCSDIEHSYNRRTEFRFVKN